jgi:hypothetical protein
MYIGWKIGGMGFRTIDKVGNDDRLVPIPGTVSLIPVEKNVVKSRILNIQFRPKIFTHSGLPDGLFSNQKSQFGNILEDLRLENVNTYIL